MALVAAALLATLLVVVYLDMTEQEQTMGQQIVWVTSAAAGLQLTRTEVTVSQWKTCVMAGACKASTFKTSSDSPQCNWGHVHRGDHPMNCVNWRGADAFCRFAGGRLPTEPEWDAEATNKGAHSYPWGNEKATCARAVMMDGCGKKRTWPVCSKPSGNSVSGLCDMSGNVWEWTSTIDQSDRLSCGGGWDPKSQFHQRSSARRLPVPSHWYYDIGFRCARGSNDPASSGSNTELTESTEDRE